MQDKLWEALATVDFKISKHLMKRIGRSKIMIIMFALMLHMKEKGITITLQAFMEFGLKYDSTQKNMKKLEKMNFVRKTRRVKNLYWEYKVVRASRIKGQTNDWLELKTKTDWVLFLQGNLTTVKLYQFIISSAKKSHNKITLNLSNKKLQKYTDEISRKTIYNHLKIIAKFVFKDKYKNIFNINKKSFLKRARITKNFLTLQEYKNAIISRSTPTSQRNLLSNISYLNCIKCSSKKLSLQNNHYQHFFSRDGKCIWWTKNKSCKTYIHQPSMEHYNYEPSSIRWTRKRSIDVNTFLNSVA
ncbi:hypothetical protein H9M94_01060 [Mycoplasma sp. Pen4]|uniref:hypothetical protein n=1 Tax=Mycoplasma sp. Pen4 TaxID=640330 RepID=UPI0016542B7F|nr:hypothetical protein [Mycoplasma sp. Pen4]QNM93752.1 hypothetical protein H9M94_00545 [Mycoplasma sp. Pen4]QNM93845.1 hypothetical protein H9M94_01045 [Mycoplasma sp. Pen4]QNM93848.1 hypothetical protein H9M94_01060 [Mycoplasma sp. Pen4]